MYEIYEIYNKKIPSYYTIRIMYRRSSDKRQNIHFKIYDNLEQPYFSKTIDGDKSIIYDYVHIVLEEFQLEDLSDEQLWSIVVITADTLKKKYNNLSYVVFNEIFKKIEKYLDERRIKHGRLGKYGGLSNGDPQSTETYLNQRANTR